MSGIPTRCPTCGSAGDRDQRLIGIVEDAEAHRKAAETFRRALRQIADAESGVWGRIAHEALVHEARWESERTK